MSGYGNRFQAIASAGLIAQDLDAEFIICWEEQPVSPVPASEVFAAEFCSSFVQTPKAVGEQFGIWRAHIPLYLNVNSRHMMITLAGHDHGEQAHMHALSRALDAVGIGYTLVFVAGGNFAFRNDTTSETNWRQRFAARRGEFYTTMPLHPSVESAAAEQHAQNPVSLGLHLRCADREHPAPNSHAITRSLRNLRARSGVNSLFIASDSAQARETWCDRATKLGFTPWCTDQRDWDRGSTSAAHGTLVDWRLLSRTQAAVYFTESTFAIEALAAGGVLDASIGLPPHPLRSAWVKGRKLGSAAITYPNRHGWLGRAHSS